MPKISYIDKKFSQGSLAVINIANNIIEEYEKMGFDLTLRQLYYQFVSRELLANKQSEYKRLGSIINDARLAGLVEVNSHISRLTENEKYINIEQIEDEHKKKLGYIADNFDAIFKKEGV